MTFFAETAPPPKTPVNLAKNSEKIEQTLGSDALHPNTPISSTPGATRVKHAIDATTEPSADISALRHGYSPAVRALEVSAVLAFVGGEAWLGWKLYAQHGLVGHWSMTLPLWVLAAYVGSDFVSGFFHWMGDTWATPQTKFWGPVFVRTFREHHIDEKEITRHDFIEVNGGNCLISLPVLAALLTWQSHLASAWQFVLCATLAIFLFFIFTTNQFHMWAHADAVPPWAAWLQQHHIILNPQHHKIHHQPPHISHYGVTNGWLNEPLRRIQFYRFAERVVQRTTGLVPRQDEQHAQPTRNRA